MRTLRFVAVLLLLAPFAFASMTTTALTGRVVVGNAPAADVTVTATSSALQGSRTTTTNARGRYWLDALPPGTYDVTFSKAGHTSLTRRAVVELARVARADAKLEVSEDEESVTSTSSTLTVAETTAVTSHITRDALQRMPVESTPNGATTLFARVPSTWVSLDNVTIAYLTEIGEEATDDVAIVYAGAGAEVDRSFGGLLAARTRRGSETFTASLRDTISNDSGLQHSFEATSGGRIVPEKLWFFASAWHGDDAWRNVEDLRGFTANVTAQIHASHNLEASYLDSDRTRFAGGGMSIAALRYTGIFGTRTSVQAVASRSTELVFNPGTALDDEHDTLSLRASHVFGDHVFSAGANNVEDLRALFVNDRWSAGHWIVNAGVRFEENDLDDHTSPRVAVAYDLHGDGRRAFFATYGDYAGLRVSSAGFATAIGTSGSARIDAIRRDGDFSTTDELRLAAQYRLFDRFEAGATYAYGDVSADFVVGIVPRHLATAWLGAQFAFGDQELGVTLLEQLAHHSRTSAITGLAVRYTIPFDRVRLTLASDVANLLGDDEVGTERAVRFWIRATR